MTANTYTYTGPGTRWEVEDPTAEDFMNVSRINVDHVHDAVNQFMDSDNPDVGAMTLNAKSIQVFPDAVETGTDENARRVIFVDLDDPGQVWDLDAFMQQAQATSWYAELGAPPIHGAMWITEGKDNLIWWDREAGSIYMQFDDNGNINLLRGNGVANDIQFLDGKIYVANQGSDGVSVIDLIAEPGLMFHVAGMYQYQGDISERNAGNSYLLLNAGTAIINNTVNAIAAVRDPELIDEFGRPKHWWAAGTDGGLSVFNPSTDAIYDGVTTDSMTDLVLTAGGHLYEMQNGSTRDILNYISSIFTVSADAWSDIVTRYANTGADALDLAWANAAVQERMAVLPGRSWVGDGSNQLWIPSNEGLYIAHQSAADASGKGGLIRLHQDYASPYMKGDCRAAWPLHAVTDVSPAGHNLTNNNVVTFASGGPAGSYADFVAASSMSLSLADHADFGGMAELTVAGWIYRDIDSGALEGLISKYDDGTAADRSFLLYISASDTIAFQSRTSSAVTSAGPTLSLATWYYVAATYDGTTQRLYLNGELVDSDAQTGSITDSAEVLVIGGTSAADAPQDFFDGRIGGVSVSATAMTANEIKAEYTRGLRRLSSTIDPNDTISDNDVASLAADPHGRYVAAAFDDGNMYIFDEYGVPVISDTLAAGTLRDVAVKSDPGADTPRYIMAGSTTVELVQPNRRILG